MRKLDKAQLGLGKVRNRITPSIEEFSVLELKYKKLAQEGVISGNLSNLHEFYPTYTVFPAGTSQDKELKINLNEIGTVRLIADEDNTQISLLGGEQGKPVFFEILNPGSNNIRWINLRSQDGENPSLSITTNGGEPSRTILEIVKLGNFYYLIGIYRDTPEYTLQDLVYELNYTFDVEKWRIIGETGVELERFTLEDTGGNTLSLGSVTLFDNIDYLSSGYEFVLTIPKEITDIFYPKFIVPIIDKLQKDTTKYYINIIN